MFRMRRKKFVELRDVGLEHREAAGDANQGPV